MSETENNAQEVKPKTSTLAKASMYSGFIGLGLMLLLWFLLWFTDNDNLFAIAFFSLLGLIIYGLLGSIIALVRIKTSKGKLKGKGIAISGITISSLIPVVIIGYIFYCFYVAIYHREPYNDSNPEAIIAKVEKVCDFDFPEKIESLKAAEKEAPGIDPLYTFTARFTTDQNSFTELRNSLSKAEDYSEEIADEFLTKEGKCYTYGSRMKKSMLRCLWLRNAPEWFDTEIPKGKIYELYSDYMIMRLYLICVELPDSNDVIVNIEGLCFDRTLVPKLINSEDANDLKLKDGRKQ